MFFRINKIPTGIIKCMPTALANCANLAIGVSISFPAVIIKSANSSITKII